MGASIYTQQMWTTSMRKILKRILSKGPLEKENMLNVYMCDHIIILIHKHYFIANLSHTVCQFVLFCLSMKLLNAFPFIYVSVCTMKTFREKIKIKKIQAHMRVNRLVFCYYSLRKLDWAEMAPCP